MYVIFNELERNLILYPAVGLLMYLRVVDHWVNFAGPNLSDRSVRLRDRTY